MKKDKKSGKMKKMYTSLRSRMLSISLSVFVFILVMVAAIAVELYENQENYITLYEEQQQLFVDQLGKQIQYMYDAGKTDADMVEFLTNEVEASGSRFFVFTKDNEVLFAKNDITTRCLGSLADKSAFYKSIQGQDISIQKAFFTVEKNSYEIAVISDLYTVKADGQLMEHQYYILLAVAIMSLVLVSLLVTLIGSWNRTQKKLEGTRKELDIRNQKMEIISQETGTLTGDKTDMLTAEAKTGVIKSERAEFYNIYTIKMLLKKSEDEQLKPLQLLFLNVVMEDRYYTKDEIFEAMEIIQESLRKVEVMGEVRKGQFVILAYRTPAQEGKKRLQELKKLCNTIEQEKGIRIFGKLVEEDEKTALERFEECE